jgi:hypothetical protein
VERGKNHLSRGGGKAYLNFKQQRNADAWMAEPCPAMTLWQDRLFAFARLFRRVEARKNPFIARRPKSASEL